MTLDTNINSIPRCLWKKAIDNDNQKREEGRNDVTFDKDKKCYECTGYNIECNEYLKHNYMEDIK